MPTNPSRGIRRPLSSSMEALAEWDVLSDAAIKWATALDEIHTKTFYGPGPHPELEAFEALEKRLHDLALRQVIPEEPSHAH